MYCMNFSSAVDGGLPLSVMGEHAENRDCYERRKTVTNMGFVSAKYVNGISWRGVG